MTDGTTTIKVSRTNRDRLRARAPFGTLDDALGELLDRDDEDTFERELEAWLAKLDAETPTERAAREALDAPLAAIVDSWFAESRMTSG